jgi:cathepsin X
MGGACTEIDYFPNATVAEYGLIDYDKEDKDGTVHKIMSEIYARGPVAATINAGPTAKYTGGIFTDDGDSKGIDHIVSIVGWGTDSETGTKYWIVRNSWGKLSKLNITTCLYQRDPRKENSSTNIATVYYFF